MNSNDSTASRPTTADILGAARLSGIPLEPADAEMCQQSSAAVWDALDALRARAGELVEQTIEPAHAEAWLRNWTSPRPEIR